MEINQLFNQLHNLPSIPKVAQDLITQFDNPTSGIEAIARNIEKDPVISAKILRLANSARFRGARESTSIEDAAMRLGFNTMRTLVLASAVTGAFSAPASFNLKGFWLKSFQVASIARLLAKQDGKDPEVAFTCGLMHNIGELLIQTGAPDMVERLNARRASASSPAHAADETLQLGFGYPEVGAELAKRWNLPKQIQDGIAYQAKPHQVPGNGPLPLLVAQACEVSDQLQKHGGPNDQARAELEDELMKGVDLPQLFAALPQVLEADKAFEALLS
jgi:HD-like signal output (HDOD) protein